MTTPSNIFGSDQNPVASAANPAVNNPAASATTGDSSVAVLVGEGRKYKTVEELAKAYVHLDSHSETVKGENAQLREELKKSKTIDDVLQRLEQPNASTQDQGADTNPKGLTADAIAKIVRDTVTGLETQKSRQDNLFKADAAMKKLFGEKAQEMFNAQASSPETRQALMQLASVDPDKFVKLFNPGTQASGSQTDSGSNVNTTALADTNQSGRVMDPGTKDYFDALRKKDQRKFYSQEVQMAMHKAAQANPEKYFGRKVG